MDRTRKCSVVAKSDVEQIAVRGLAPEIQDVNDTAAIDNCLRLDATVRKAYEGYGCRLPYGSGDTNAQVRHNQHDM